MVTISQRDPEEEVFPYVVYLTARQVQDLAEELNEYNKTHLLDNQKPFRTVGEYVVFLLEVLEREF